MGSSGPPTHDSKVGQGPELKFSLLESCVALWAQGLRLTGQDGQVTPPNVIEIAASHRHNQDWPEGPTIGGILVDGGSYFILHLDRWVT